MAEDEDADQDRIEKVEVTSAGDGYTLSLKTKSEEFEFIADRNTLQELADEIYDLLDKDEPKKT
jgi:hypothetical protein